MRQFSFQNENYIISLWNTGWPKQTLKLCSKVQLKLKVDYRAQWKENKRFKILDFVFGCVSAHLKLTEWIFCECIIFRREMPKPSAKRANWQMMLLGLVKNRCLFHNARDCFCTPVDWVGLIASLLQWTLDVADVPEKAPSEGLFFRNRVASPCNSNRVKFWSDCFIKLVLKNTQHGIRKNRGQPVSVPFQNLQSIIAHHKSHY